MGFAEQLLDYNLCQDYPTCILADISEYSRYSNLLSHLSTFQHNVWAVALRSGHELWAVKYNQSRGEVFQNGHACAVLHVPPYRFRGGSWACAFWRSSVYCDTLMYGDQVLTLPHEYHKLWKYVTGITPVFNEMKASFVVSYDIAYDRWKGIRPY